MNADRVTPVILSGGAGSRLWPLSRRERPKQMIPLAGPESMLALTAKRVGDSAKFDRAIVIAPEGQGELVQAEIAAAGAEMAKLFLEPCARNTAPAIALAALSVDPDALLLVMPSDHLVRDVVSFSQAVAKAVPLAKEGWIVTFGIHPERPETGYGYIRRGQALTDGVFEVLQFVEKPDQATACRYLSDGDYSWNGGIFLFRAGALLERFAECAPDILASVHASLEGADLSSFVVRPEKAAFAAARNLSIDYAVIEKARDVAVVPVEMGWSDVGSWSAIYDLGSPDEDGNVIAGESLAIGTSDCLLHSNGPLIVAIGVHELAIVATSDAILVVPRGQEQQVKDAVERLSKEDHPSLIR